MYNSLSQTLFDYNTLVSCSIFLKFSGKTPDAIFLPQFSFRVVIFSLRPEFRFVCTFSRSTYYKTCLTQNCFIFGPQKTNSGLAEDIRNLS